MQSSIHLRTEAEINVEKHRGLRAEVVLNVDDQCTVFLTQEQLKELKKRIEYYFIESRKEQMLL